MVSALSVAVTEETVPTAASVPTVVCALHAAAALPHVASAADPLARTIAASVTTTAVTAIGQGVPLMATVK